MKLMDIPKRIFGVSAKQVLEASIKQIINDSPSEMLLAASIVMLEELSTVQSEMRAKSGKITVAHRAEHLGFTSSYMVSEQRRYEHNVTLLQFMLDMWHDLGKSAILIRLDHFRNLLEKYDLMCVPFAAYRGDIPEDNLVEIEAIAQKLCGLGEIEAERYAQRLRLSWMVASTSVELLNRIRFPFHHANEGSLNDLGTKLDRLIGFDFAPVPQGIMFIAAPKDYVEKPTIAISEPTTILSHLSAEKRRYGNSILRGVSQYANVKYSPEPKPLLANYDPFVCSLCDHGVIIHSMWGAEAEDATIKRYTQLRDTIISNSKQIRL